MEALFIRHAPAGDREKFTAKGGDDAQRPLTPAGRWKMKKAARGLAKVVGVPDALAASPLVRARQTAAIVAQVFGISKPLQIAELSPGRAPQDLVKRLQTMGRTRLVALVGHEPHLSTTIGHLIGAKGLKLELKKGGCCLVRFSGKPAAGAGTLIWSLAPAHLRKLA